LAAAGRSAIPMTPHPRARRKRLLFLLLVIPFLSP
jgi:hypothetical protein